MNIFVWSQLALVCLLGAMSPGPSLAVIIRNSITYNRIAGIFSSVGHGLGIGLYATIAVVGLGVIIQTYVNLFVIIQVIGSIFLAGLGLIFIFKSNNKVEIDQPTVNTNSFLQGFLIAFLNPKILIWFTAIYSHFIRSEADNLEKTILISTAAIIDTVWYTIVSILVTGYGFKSFLDKKKSSIQKLMGMLLIIISLGLLYKLISF